MIENTQWKWCHRSLFSAVIFTIICISAFEFIDGMSGGYAISFISFTLAITGVAVAALFYSRARVMDSIMNSEHPLAHWIYSSEEVEQSARREYTEYQERNRAMFIIIGGMLAFVALIMMIFAGDEGFITGEFLLAFAILLFIISRVAPMIALKNALAASKEAYIAENGIIYEGAVYPFKSFLMKMEQVAFKEKIGKKPAILVFSFSQIVGLNIASQFEIGIPVPEGEEETALRIAGIHQD